MSDLVERFSESLVMNHDRWRDGEGYALGLLDEASGADRAAIERLILSRAVRDWRDVEALAVLGTEAARKKLREAFQGGDAAIRLALVMHAADHLTEEEACGVLLPILKEKGIHDGLTGALLVIEDFHPAPVIEALLDAARDRDGAVAIACAAMLLYLHGLASSPHGFDDRPFLVRFLEASERAAAHDELRAKIAAASVKP